MITDSNPRLPPDVCAAIDVGVELEFWFWAAARRRRWLEFADLMWVL